MRIIKLLIYLTLFCTVDNQLLSVLTDRSEGGSSLQEGQLEIMLHRQLHIIVKTTFLKTKIYLCKAIRISTILVIVKRVVTRIRLKVSWRSCFTSSSTQTHSKEILLTKTYSAAKPLEQKTILVFMKSSFTSSQAAHTAAQSP